MHDSNIVVFTDGSFENGVGLWGAVILDDATGQRDVFWGQVPDVLIKGWNRLAGEQVISQIEAYAALLVRWYFRKQWTGRKAIFFQDNDAARYSLNQGSQQFSVHDVDSASLSCGRCIVSYDGLDF